LTAKIPSPGQAPLPFRAVVKTDHPSSGPDFSSLVDGFRDNPTPADFLGQDAVTTKSAAKPFNADGFFDRLETSGPSGDQNAPAGVTGHEANFDDGPSVEAASGEPIRQSRAVDAPRDGAGAPTLPPTGAAIHVVQRNSVSSATNRLAVVAQLAVPPTTEPEPLPSVPAVTTAKQGQRNSRFNVMVEGSSVHIASAVELSKEEESQLVERVAELLSEHGQSLASVRLNGRQLVQSLKDQR